MLGETFCKAIFNQKLARSRDELQFCSNDPNLVFMHTSQCDESFRNESRLGSVLESTENLRSGTE
jgi:hypothetical protein